MRQYLFIILQKMLKINPLCWKTQGLKAVSSVRTGFPTACSYPKWCSDFSSQETSRKILKIWLIKTSETCELPTFTP